MSKTIDPTKLTKLHELDALLPREIRGQSQILPRIASAVRRGELGLTKRGRPRGSFMLLRPTGVGKTETVVVLTKQVFGAGKLFRFDTSKFQTQESLGLLLGARLGEPSCRPATIPCDENLEANSGRRRKAQGGTEATTRSILELSAAALSFREVFIAATATSRMARQANGHPPENLQRHCGNLPMTKCFNRCASLRRK